MQVVSKVISYFCKRDLNFKFICSKDNILGSRYLASGNVMVWNQLPGSIEILALDHLFLK